MILPGETRQGGCRRPRLDIGSPCGQVELAGPAQYISVPNVVRVAGLPNVVRVQCPIGVHMDVWMDPVTCQQNSVPLNPRQPLDPCPPLAWIAMPATGVDSVARSSAELGLASESGSQAAPETRAQLLRQTLYVSVIF